MALIHATVTAEQWQMFGAEHGKRIGADVQRYLPWVLDDASPDIAEKLPALLSKPVRSAYRDEWQPAYAELTLWGSPCDTATR